MSALPCVSDLAQRMLDRMGDEEARAAHIARRAAEIAEGHWRDLESVSDFLANASAGIGHYRHGRVPHPRAVEFLTLLRDGTDDLRCMRLLREAMRQECFERAELDAEDEVASRGRRSWS